MENKAMRFNNGKTKWSLVDMPTIEAMIKVLEAGAEKYSPFNWKKGLKFTEQYESLMRHIVAYFFNGEENDPETGLPHLDHAQCNIHFLAWHARNKKDFDDRDTLNPDLIGEGIQPRTIELTNVENITPTPPEGWFFVEQGNGKVLMIEKSHKELIEEIEQLKKKAPVWEKIDSPYPGWVDFAESVKATEALECKAFVIDEFMFDLYNSKAGNYSIKKYVSDKYTPPTGKVVLRDVYYDKIISVFPEK